MKNKIPILSDLELMSGYQMKTAGRVHFPDLTDTQLVKEHRINNAERDLIPALPSRDDHNEHQTNSAMTLFISKIRTWINHRGSHRMTGKPVLKTYIPPLFAIIAFTVGGCQTSDPASDAYGTFEATEINISSEVGGLLQRFDVAEGMRLEAGRFAAQIDTIQAHLERMQLQAQRESVRSRLANISAQAAVYSEQIAVATRELERTERMLAGNAATRKQYDDLSGQIRILERQIESVEAQRANVTAEIAAIDAGIARTEDRIARSTIRNPAAGTVLARYAESHELVAQGRPLYRIADLETMYLRVFVSGNQLPRVRIGAEVRVLIDGEDGSLQSLPGEVSWISDKAEFTPRIIQTREERVNLVYAVKVRVPNPGGVVKIGMPGEVVF